MNTIKLAKAVLLRWPLLRTRFCVVCERAVGGFIPYRGGVAGASPVSRALRVVGSNLDNFECPRCGAHDRERHLLLYMRSAGLWRGLRGSSILHFAPERHLTPLIQRENPARHVRCDMFPAEPGVEKVDLQQIPFDDASFDFVIANHVLEHVHDDGKATAEIARVLVPGGHAILQTPFSALLAQTFADPGIEADSARWLMYGQEDHVRLYGRDIFDRLSHSGRLQLCVSTHGDLLPDVDPVRHGVNADEPFFLYRKP